MARPALADVLAQVVGAVADEATRSPRFAKTLTDALVSTPPAAPAADVTNTAAPAKRSKRRPSGLFDPFAVYRESGEDGLRSRLSELNPDQLKDIIAEHGMDHDRLAMRWKTPKKLIDRIVEKVTAAVAKGSAFR
ncbi:hypothetical protein AB0K11_05435 [Mycobacterium sp. NPDC050551]|uniref:hypothetical protein n=1 Tax=Mycobacterium sp. NPDC050551 TaxID=3155407 RepID=UPI00342B4929